MSLFRIGRRYRRHRCVDPQHLTIPLTLQILLDAAQEVVEEEGYEKESRQLRKLVLNDEDFAEGDARSKLWPTSSDCDAFRAAMTNGQDASAYDSSLVAQAHEFLGLQIHEWLCAADPMTS